MHHMQFMKQTENMKT